MLGLHYITVVLQMGISTSSVTLLYRGYSQVYFEGQNGHTFVIEGLKQFRQNHLFDHL